MALAKRPGAHCKLQSAPWKLPWHSHVPLDSAAPCPEHVVASEYWHWSPTQPVSHAVQPMEEPEAHAEQDEWQSAKKYWAVDGIHPNDEGYRVWGEHIAHDILPHLQRNGTAKAGI